MRNMRATTSIMAGLGMALFILVCRCKNFRRPKQPRKPRNVQTLRKLLASAREGAGPRTGGGP